jgi:site-specific DNA-methyltransferase (adenine-specific)
MATSSTGNRFWVASPPGRLLSMNCGEIVCADALDFLNALKDECADIVFLDPPFNLGKAYGKNGSHDDRKKEGDYLDYMQRIIARSAAVLKDGGALYLYHIPKWAVRLSPLLERSLSFRHWIAVSMKNGFVRGAHL